MSCREVDPYLEGYETRVCALCTKLLTINVSPPSPYPHTPLTTHLQSFPSAGKMYTDACHNSRPVLQTERCQKEAVGGDVRVKEEEVRIQSKM